MKARFILLILTLCLSCGFTTQALAGNDGFTVSFNPTTSIAYVGYEFPLGFVSWGPESEGNWHPRANPLVIQYDQIQNAELCVLDGGPCVPAWFSTTMGGMFIMGGTITIPWGRDLQIRVTTWVGDVYWAPMDQPGKPISRYWHLTGCYGVQRTDGTWGVRTDP